MTRSILNPAPLADAALDELKHWLAITTAIDDALLRQHLRAALDLCEAFTGVMPLAAEYEEVLPASGQWQQLRSRPVQAITQVDLLTVQGVRTALNPADYAIELDADGAARVRLLRLPMTGRMAVRCTAGLVAGWDDLPVPLRQGALRLAAHLYRQRDQADLAPVPPASVAALWRPWRRMRLA